jgi:hypothetical protein
MGKGRPGDSGAAYGLLFIWGGASWGGSYKRVAWPQIEKSPGQGGLGLLTQHFVEHSARSATKIPLGEGIELASADL